MKHLLVYFASTICLFAQQSAAFLHGTVLDAHGSAIVGIRVEVASGSTKCVAVSNAEGKFNCKLFAGTYDVSATGVNIVPYRRAPVSLEASRHKWIYVRPTPRAPSDQTGISDPLLMYEVLPGAGLSNGLVQFDSSELRGDSRIFVGRHVVLTFDDLAVYAGEIACSIQSGVCSAKGVVAAEDGAERLEGASAAVDIRSRTLTLNREPIVVRHF